MLLEVNLWLFYLNIIFKRTEILWFFNNHLKYNNVQIINLFKVCNFLSLPKKFRSLNLLNISRTLKYYFQAKDLAVSKTTQPK